MSELAKWSVFLSGGALGFVVGALCVGAHAFDKGFRAGQSYWFELRTRTRTDEASLRQVEEGC